jgi:hypothetical protein
LERKKIMSREMTKVKVRKHIAVASLVAEKREERRRKKRRKTGTRKRWIAARRSKDVRPS